MCMTVSARAHWDPFCQCACVRSCQGDCARVCERVCVNERATERERERERERESVFSKYSIRMPWKWTSPHWKGLWPYISKISVSVSDCMDRRWRVCTSVNSKERGEKNKKKNKTNGPSFRLSQSFHSSCFQWITEQRSVILNIIIMHNTSIAQCPKHDLAQSALHTKKYVHIYTVQDISNRVTSGN